MKHDEYIRKGSDRMTGFYVVWILSILKSTESAFLCKAATEITQYKRQHALRYVQAANEGRIRCIQCTEIA